MSNFPWFKFSAFMFAAGGFGYVVMKLTVPTEEQLYNRMAPDLQRRVDARRALRRAMEEETNKQATAQTIKGPDPETAKPIWLDTPPRPK